MGQSDNTNSGGLWKNDRRTTDTHPNATGNAHIECPVCNTLTSYFMDAWTNDKDGVKWQRVKFKPRDKQAPATPKPPVDEDDEPIPF